MSEFYKKFAEMQSEIVDPIVDAEGQIGHRKYKYVTLLELLKSVRTRLNEHGFSITETMQSESGWIILTVTIRHGDFPDDSIKSSLPIRYVDDPQALGSAITYARRYLIRAIVSVADDRDDDGKVASDYYKNNNVQTTVPMQQTFNQPVGVPTQTQASTAVPTETQYAKITDPGDYDGEIVSYRQLTQSSHWTLFEVVFNVVNNSTGEVIPAVCNTYSKDVVEVCDKAIKGHEDCRITVKQGKTGKLAISKVEILDMK